MPSECLGKTKEWQYYWEVYIRTIGDDDAIFSLNSLICNRTCKVVGEEDGIVLPARGIEGGFEGFFGRSPADSGGAGSPVVSFAGPLRTPLIRPQATLTPLGLLFFRELHQGDLLLEDLAEA